MAALNAGVRLGPYEILEPLGTGGMGEVYRGLDTRLDRVVAIKVLAPGLAKDVTSRERFEREAKTISSLNHSNICVLYDIGHEEPMVSNDPAVDFLVMEFLEGETLSRRLGRGRLTVDKALAIAIPIAAALDCAHRQGVVHRDLKPANVMLLANGTVKLLDFGLARLLQSGGDRRESIGQGMVTLADLSMPTVTSPLTVKGTILGTLQYMAPEQLEGKEVDARADIFAFGGMLYEMVTGKRPFEGRSQASLIGAILDHQPPPVSTSQPQSPPMVDEIVARCLEKNPDDRWQTMRDLKRQLEWIAGRTTSGAVQLENVSERRLSRSRILPVAAALLIGAAITAAVVGTVLRPASAPPVIGRFVVQLPDDQVFTRPGRHVIALSRDGSMLVYVANQQLYLRRLNQLSAAPISGTEGTNPDEPVFSPDGQWIAYWSNSAVKKIPVSGGTPVAICDLANPYGMSWSGDRLLIGSFAPRGIVAVPASGGAPEALVRLDEKRNEFAQSPTLINGGRAVLFSLRVAPAAWDDASIVAQDLATGERKVLVAGATDPRVLPTGHIVYVRQGTLFAIAFDESRLEVSGKAISLEQGIRQSAVNSSGAAQWVWSPSGSAAFIPGEVANNQRTLMWVDHNGREERTTAPVRYYDISQGGLRISPDGTRVAVTSITDRKEASGAVGSDIWVWDIARNTLSRLTSNGRAVTPVWTADSRQICYRSETTVFCQAANGSGQPRTMLSFTELTGLKSVSGDGTHFLVNTTGTDLAVATIGPPVHVRPLLKTSFNETSAAFSPDGRWFAYQSNDTGTSEVYVRSFPDVDRVRWQVSAQSGFAPRWSRDGNMLFFLTGGGPNPSVVWQANVHAGETFTSDKPVMLVRLGNYSSAAYDIGIDGRVLVHAPGSESPVSTPTTTARQIVVVQNWIEEFRALLATQR